MNALQVFSFDQSNIRCVERDGEPWFVASDIAKALNYSNPNEAVRDHCKYVKKITGSELLCASDYAACRASGYSHNDAVRQWLIVPEPDVYRLIFRSNKPEAQAFEDWVVSEVLPSIRKTGGYQIDTEKLASMVLELAAKIDLLTSKPKAEFIKVKDIANMIGSGYTSNDANQALMAIGLQVKYHNGRQSVWMPTNKAKAYCKKIGSGLIWNATYISEVKDKIQQVLEIKV